MSRDTTTSVPGTEWDRGNEKPAPKKWTPDDETEFGNGSNPNGFDPTNFDPATGDGKPG